MSGKVTIPKWYADWLTREMSVADVDVVGLVGLPGRFIFGIDLMRQEREQDGFVHNSMDGLTKEQADWITKNSGLAAKAVISCWKAKDDENE